MPMLIRPFFFALLAALLPAHFALSEDCPTLLRQPKETKKYGEMRVKAIRGWDKLITWALSPKNRDYPYVAPPKTLQYTEDAVSLQAFDKNYGYFSVSHPIVGIVTESDRDVQTVNCLMESIFSELSDPRQRDFSEDEIFSKAMAYRTLKEGMKVRGPSGGMYVVDHIIDLWRGMPAFCLVPEERNEGPPILLYRGTDLDLTSEKGWASVLSDLDTSGPGHYTFLRARDEVHDWLVSAENRYEKARVMGFSLGGVLVYYTLIYESELVSTSAVSVAFNPPGVSENLFDTWEKMGEKPPLSTYVNRGDFVSQIGFLLADVWEISLQKPMGVIAAHATLISAQSKYEMQQVDVAKCNQSRKY